MKRESYELGSKLRLGALWSYINTGGITLIQFIAGIILARILAPEDFGVFIAVSAYTTLLQIQVRFGMPTALVQSKDLHKAQLNQSFWLMELIAVAATALVFTLSGWLSEFYHDDRYVSLMSIMTITFFTAPFLSINGSLLRRKLNFKSISQIWIIAALIAVPISIALSLLGYGPYSLAWGGIASTVVAAAMMARKAPWRPSMPRNYRGFSDLLRFAWKTNVNVSLETLSNRVDNMMIGSLLSTYALGIYNRAFSLSRMPVDQLATSLRPVIISALSRIQDDIEHSSLMNQKILCGMSLIVFPLLVLLMLTADSLIATLYGEKWLPAAAPLKIMALGSFATALTVSLRAMIASQNLVGKEMPIQLINLSLTIAIVAGGYSWGLNAIAAGIALKELVVFILIKRVLARSHMEMKISQLVEAVSPPLVAAVITAMISLAVQEGLLGKYGETSAQYLFFSAAILGISYLASIVVLAKLFRHNEILQANLDIARRHIQATAARFKMTP